MERFMSIDILLTVAQVVVGLLLAGVGIEMANNPPQTSGKKWTYRVIFIVLGIFAVGITIGQAVKTGRDQQEARTLTDNERRDAQRDRLDRAKEIGNLQGQLQSMQQVLGHVLSNSDPKQSAAMWKSIFSSAALQRPAIERMSNKELQSKVISYANDLRKFIADFEVKERGHIDQQMAAMRAVPTEDRSKQTQIWNEQNQITANMYSQLTLDFKENYLGNAITYRDELLRRLGPQPADTGINRPLALDGWIAPMSVDATATYLDKLARKLPE
jgi:hypothetical protein